MLVRLYGEYAVHDLEAVEALDGVLCGVGGVVFDDGSGEAPAEVVLLDQALLQRALGREKFLRYSLLTKRSSLVNSGLSPITRKVRGCFSLSFSLSWPSLYERSCLSCLGGRLYFSPRCSRSSRKVLRLPSNCFLMNLLLKGRCSSSARFVFWGLS